MTKYYLSTLCLISLISFDSSAGRKVTIPIDGPFKLSNTSAVNVNYNITCKDKDGATISALSSSNQVVNAGATKVVTSSSTSSLCASGWTENVIGGGASPLMKRCYNVSGTAISSMNSACSATAHVCTLEEVASLKGASNNSGEYGAFACPSTWSFSSDGGGTWTDYNGNTTTYGTTKFNSSGFARFNNGSNGTGSVTFADDGYYSTSGPVTQIYCCL